jgi:hypothetical protein
MLLLSLSRGPSPAHLRPARCNASGWHPLLLVPGELQPARMRPAARPARVYLQAVRHLTRAGGPSADARRSVVLDIRLIRAPLGTSRAPTRSLVARPARPSAESVPRSLANPRRSLCPRLASAEAPAGMGGELARMAARSYRPQGRDVQHASARTDFRPSANSRQSRIAASSVRARCAEASCPALRPRDCRRRCRCSVPFLPCPLRCVLCHEPDVLAEDRLRMLSANWTPPESA